MRRYLRQHQFMGHLFAACLRATNLCCVTRNQGCHIKVIGTLAGPVITAKPHKWKIAENATVSQKWWVFQVMVGFPLGCSCWCFVEAGSSLMTLQMRNKQQSSFWESASSIVCLVWVPANLDQITLVSSPQTQPYVSASVFWEVLIVLISVGPCDVCCWVSFIYVVW